MTWNRAKACGVLVAVFGGCRAHASITPPLTIEEDPGSENAVVADILEHHRFHHQGGVLMLTAMSLDALGLPDEKQIQAERIQSDLLGKLRPAVHAERDLVNLLADGVSAGAIDRARVDAAVAEVARTTAEARKASIDDVNRLHALLSPSERSALIDRIDAHWALWRQANAGDQGHVSVVGKELALTADQLAKVQSSLDADAGAAPKLDSQVDAELRELTNAFRWDTFDAHTLAAADPGDRQMAAVGAGRLARFCEAVNPVLNEGQRATLVDILRSHLNHDQPEAVQP